eukprot:gene19792-21732_t
MASAKDFLSDHLAQLMAIGLPEDLIPNLYSKLFPDIVFDAGNVFVFSEKNGDEGQGKYKLIAKTSIGKHGDIFLVDHAWTSDGGNVAKQQLEKMPQLLLRMQEMFAFKSIDLLSDNDSGNYGMEKVVSDMCSCSLDEARLALKESNECIIDAIDRIASGSAPREEKKQEDGGMCSYEEFKKAMSSCAPELSAADISESYMEKLYAGFLKQKGKGVGAAMTATYNWTDSVEDGFVYVYVAVKPCTKKQGVKSQLNASHWKLEVDGMGVIIDGDLSEYVLVDESYWSIESSGVLCMALRKKDSSERLMTELIKGEKQLSASEIEQAAWRNEMKKSTEIREVLDAMWLCNQTYTIGSNRDQQSKQHAPKWYVMDEVGSSMQHSSEPNFACMPFFFLNKGIAFSLIWPLRDIGDGEQITRNFLPNILHGETKDNYNARVSILVPDELMDVPKTILLEKSQISAKSIADDINFIDIGVSGTSGARKTIFCDYVEFESLKTIVARLGCAATKNITDADILLPYKQPHIGAINSGALISHFKHEDMVLKKHQLAKHVKDHFGCPAWFPRTFVLCDEMSQFIHMAVNEKPNTYWILRTSDSSTAEFEPVITGHLLRIARLSEAGNIIASEFALNGPLFKGRVFSLSYVILIKQTQPKLQMFVHTCPYITTAKTPFNQSKMLDEYDNSSLITKKPKESLNTNRQDEFEELKKVILQIAKKNLTECTWKDIEGKIFACVGSLFNSMKNNLNSFDNMKSFALVNADFVFNSKLEPLLVGIDSLPSFANESVLTNILSTLIHDFDKKPVLVGDCLVKIETS